MNRLFMTIFISALCDIKTDASLSHIVAQDLSESVRSQRDINNEDPTISELHITSRIVSRFSTTNIRSTFLNDLEADVEAQFVVQIPDSAFISNFSVIVNGREIVAQIMEKGAAKEAYNEAKDKNLTAGHVEQSSLPDPDRGFEYFTMNVNIRGGASATFNLEYQELLQRRDELYMQRISVEPRQIVESLRVEVLLYEPQGIVDLHVQEPTFSNSLTPQDTAIERPSRTFHHIVYEPSAERQRLLDESGYLGDFVLHYDVEEREDLGYVVRSGDYFAHFFSVPEAGLDVLDKNVVFVMDISGSMGGRKIEQTRSAMTTILSQLSAKDNFAMIFFDDRQLYWPEERHLVSGHGDNIAQAKRAALKNLVATGSTGMNDALVSACRLFRRQESAPGQNTIVFLTDGRATDGETRADAIASNVVNACGEVTVFSLGFGFDLDFNLLQKISARTRGAARRIYDETDASEQLTNFFSEIQSPIFYNLQFNYPRNDIDRDSLTQTNFAQFYSGSEVVVGGKVLLDTPTLEVSVSTQRSSQPDERSMTVGFSSLQIPDTAAAVARDDLFMERLYAYLKIKDLLHETYALVDKVAIEEREQEALRLSMKYHLVTPLTSLLVVEKQELDADHGRLESDYDYDDYAVLRADMVPMDYYDDIALLKPGSNPSYESAAGNLRPTFSMSLAVLMMPLYYF